MLSKPKLFTFDIFGTVVDWQRGMKESLARYEREMGEDDFDRIVDAQGREEQSQFRSYREITADSLIQEIDVPTEVADLIGEEVGRWPLFPDSAEGLRQLMKIAPCVAMTNSDRQHGVDVQKSLGFSLSHWFCAEDLKVYKPSPEFWREVSRLLKIPLDSSWCHVSAYADYDLNVARSLGLTTVFIPREHSRLGPADMNAKDLLDLAKRF